MLRTRNITVNGTPSLLTIPDHVDTPNTISIQNTDPSNPVYIGDESVTTSSYGIKLIAGQIFSADLGAYDKLYAIGSGTVSVLILER
jgi:hypothetical protein